MKAILTIPMAWRVLLSLILASFAHSASACDLRLDVGNVLVGGGGLYDPLADTQETAVVDVVVSRDDTVEDCDFALVVRPVVPIANGTEWLLRQGTDSLRFTLARDASAAQILRPVAAATSNNVLVGQIPAGSTETRLQLFALIAPGQLVPPGDYQTPIELELSSTSIASERLEVSIGATVRGSASISIVDGSASRILDFEELEQDERLGTQVSVRSNVVYFLSINSENGGRLKREGATGSNDYDFVDYTAFIDHQVLTSLSQLSMLGPFSEQDETHDTQFQIGSVERKRAGTYSDFVTIEVRLIN